MMTDYTQTEVEARIEGLGRDAEAVVCALLGHSRVQSACFGYYNCCRCEAQVGDALGSTYSAALLAVVLDHHCDVCRENAKSLTWRDTFRLPMAALEYLALLADEKRSKRRAAAMKRKYERVRAALSKRADAGSEVDESLREA